MSNPTPKNSQTYSIVLQILKDDYTKADNYRKVYLAYLGRQGFEMTPETYLMQPGLSDARINRVLEDVLKDLAVKVYANECGFTDDQYQFFASVRSKGKKQARQVKEDHGYPTHGFRILEAELETQIDARSNFQEDYEKATML